MFFSRPLVPCIVSYVVGLWLVHDLYHDMPGLAYAAGGLMVGLAVAVALAFRNPLPFYLLALAGLGVAVMGARENQHLQAMEIAKALEGPAYKTITGKVDALSELDDTERSRITLSDVHVTSGTTNIGLPGKVQVNLNPAAFEEGSVLPAPGEILSFPGRIVLPSSLRNFFGYNRAEALRNSQVYISAIPAAIPGVVSVLKPRWAIWSDISRVLSTFRRAVTANLEKAMWSREARLMNAMLFNDMRSLTDEERQVFRDSATFHLFAVSGMHVAILGMALNLVFRAFSVGVRASWILVAIILFFYLWVIGFVPSATRSYLMLVAFTASYMLGREIDSLSSLVFAIAVVVAYDPAAPWQAGFILSVIGVVAVVIFTPLMKLWFTDVHKHQNPGWIGVAKSHITEALFATIAATIVLLPLQLYYFGFCNTLSTLANLLQAGLSTAVLSAGVLAAAAGLISEAAGQVFGQGASALMWLVYFISEQTAQADWALLYFREVPAWLMLSSYALIFSGYYVVTQDTPEFRLKSRARFVTHSFSAVGLLFLYQLVVAAPTRAIEIWCFDIGQGDSTLVRLPGGETVLIDGGVDEPDMGRLVVVSQLRALGIERLDYIIATHDDSDHTGGLASVINGVGAKTLLIPHGMQAKSRATLAMLEAAKMHHCVVSEVGQGFTSNVDGCVIQILNPPPVADPNIPDNDQSVVVKFTLGKFSALLMGDASAAVESRLINEHSCDDVTLLKLGHHGSKSSTSEEFVEAARPKLSLVSCGVNNKFGHPDKSVLTRLTRANSSILRTDTQGALFIQSDGETVKYRCSGS